MLKISGVLANPSGSDKGAEYVMVTNTGVEPAVAAGWSLRTSAGKPIRISGVIDPGGSIKVMTGSVMLKNTGDTLSLVSPSDRIVDTFRYGAAKEGALIERAEFLSLEARATLFEASSFGDIGQLRFDRLGNQHLLPAFFVAATLALLAIYILKQIRYDEIVQTPFKEDLKK